MIRIHLKIALRNFFKTKQTTLIKVGGLAVGMACCMLIIVFIADELSFNSFHKNIDRIYRLNWVVNNEGQQRKFAYTPVPLAPAIAQDVPGVLAAARLYSRSGSMEITEHGIGKKRFQEQGVYFADAAFFKVFSTRFIHGNPSKALSQAASIVLTDSMAKKYFGTGEAIGKTLFYDNKTLLKVTAVVAQMPARSDLQFDFLVAFETLYAVESPEIANYLRTDWTYNPVMTFILTHQNALPSLESNLQKILKKYGDERVQKMNRVVLQPLSKIHLYGSEIEGRAETGSIAFIYVFAFVALLILFVASVNFINLSNAQSFKRMKEVGIRKVFGAGKKQLIRQFLGEGLLYSLAAFVLATALAIAGLPLLNELTGKRFDATIFLQGKILAVFLLTFLCTGLVSGLYPAFFITRLQPSAVLKRRAIAGSGGILTRKALIVSQFVIAVVLILGAYTVHLQISYLRDKPLGFQKEQVLTVPLFGSQASGISYGVDGPMRKRLNVFEDELLNYNRIRNVSLASELPGNGFIRGLVIPEGRSEKDNIFIPWLSIDYDFLQTLLIPLVAGRNFSKETGTDHLQAFIINEAAVNLFGWKSPGEALGKSITRGDQENGKKGQIIGVIKNFNYSKLDQTLEPLIMDVNAGRFTLFAIHIAADHIPETIRYIQTKWNQAFPERLFEFNFLEENIDNLYRAEKNMGRMIMYFASLAILLSCMGLFSLVSFMAAGRTREIGIRKVLGATVGNIVALLSRELLSLLVMAFALAFPLAWYLIYKWLQNFAYRISIEWWIFSGTGIFVFLIAFLIVGLQALKAALANPIKSLRSEDGPL